MDQHLTSPSRESRSGRRSDTNFDAMNEQLCADIVQRWHRGERVPVEAYLRQHPELETGECVFELILTEVALRQEYGDTPPLDEFLWRFPRFEERLRRHFGLQAGLAVAAHSLPSP